MAGKSFKFNLQQKDRKRLQPQIQLSIDTSDNDREQSKIKTINIYKIYSPTYNQSPKDFINQIFTARNTNTPIINSRNRYKSEYRQKIYSFSGNKEQQKIHSVKNVAQQKESRLLNDLFINTFKSYKFNFKSPSNYKSQDICINEQANKSGFQNQIIKEKHQDMQQQEQIKQQEHKKWDNYLTDQRFRLERKNFIYQQKRFHRRQLRYSSEAKEREQKLRKPVEIGETPSQSAEQKFRVHKINFMNTLDNIDQYNQKQKNRNSHYKDNSNKTTEKSRYIVSLESPKQINRDLGYNESDNNEITVSIIKNQCMRLSPKNKIDDKFKTEQEQINKIQYYLERCKIELNKPNIIKKDNQKKNYIIYSSPEKIDTEKNKEYLQYEKDIYEIINLK